MNGFALASVILAGTWLWGIGSIFGIIFGLLAKGQIREQGGQGGALATAGIAVGCAGIAGVLLMILLLALSNA